MKFQLGAADKKRKAKFTSGRSDVKRAKTGKDDDDKPKNKRPKVKLSLEERSKKRREDKKKARINMPIHKKRQLKKKRH